MGLPWVRLDSSMPDNPKILRLASTPAGKAAAFVWLCSLAYSGKHETDGYIPREALSRVNGSMADARRLVEAGLWDEGERGWHIHGWAEFQRVVWTEDELRSMASNGGKARMGRLTPEERSELGRRAAQARWAGET